MATPPISPRSLEPNPTTEMQLDPKESSLDSAPIDALQPEDHSMIDADPQSDEAVPSGSEEVQPVHVTVPLDSAQRTTPIHPSLNMLKMPDQQDAYPVHPTTLQPLSRDLLVSYLPEIMQQYRTAQDAAVARDELARQMKTIAEENLRRRDDIDREIQNATKQRDMERRVYNKMMDAKRMRSMS